MQKSTEKIDEILGEYVSSLEVEHPYTSLNCTPEQDKKIWNDKVSLAESHADEFWEHMTGLTNYIKDHIKETLGEMRDD